MQSLLVKLTVVFTIARLSFTLAFELSFLLSQQSTRGEQNDRQIVGIRNPWTPWRLYAKQCIHSYRPKEWLFKIRTLKFIENWSYHWSLWFYWELNLTNKINETKGTTFNKYRLCHFWVLLWFWRNLLI